MRYQPEAKPDLPLLISRRAAQQNIDTRPFSLTVSRDFRQSCPCKGLRESIHIASVLAKIAKRTPNVEIEQKLHVLSSAWRWNYHRISPAPPDVPSRCESDMAQTMNKEKVYANA